MSLSASAPRLPQPAPATLRIRLLCLVYEALLLAALLIVATALFVAVAGDSSTQPLRSILQIYIAAVTGVYFVWSWSEGRRTLAMRTWRLRLVHRTESPPGVGVALVRFLTAAVSGSLAGAAWWWAVFDRDGLFLHDRVAGTRLVRDPSPASARKARPAS